MARRRIKLAFIVNNAARKAAFKKRKQGFLKKLHELTVLCGIDACAVVKGPFDAEPEIWPADPVRIREILTKFKGIPQAVKFKKMLDQKKFLKEQIAKVEKQIEKRKEENLEKEMNQVLQQCFRGRSLLSLNVWILNGLCWFIDQKLRDINIRTDMLTRASWKNLLHRTPMISQVSSSSGAASVGVQSVPGDQMSMTGSSSIIPGNLPISNIKTSSHGPWTF